MSFFNLISTGGLALAASLAVSTAAFAASPAPAAPAPAPAAPAGSDRITNPVAEFAGIDKITGRIITFDVYIDETVQFGALQVTPRVCYSRPQTEEPKTDSFVEVDEITLDRKIRRIFTGWMFAESPGLNAVEHAVYDVWLKECKQKSDVPSPGATKADATKADASKPAAKPTTAKPAATSDVEQPAPTEPDTSDTN
ncbi:MULTISPECIES: DUF2155 domain-containing protein [Mesorhizobium]|uniref:Glycosyl hydrolase family 5 n=1 Tax=Rhizobium loti TaxID=381 RepID=A0A6M7U3A3_RHILI|nr:MULTISPECIES: DUF2155 domain-containing protein [Mesorhizobium]KRB30769.1 glycosyl hydrolase family 5 [Mesorhizobium sp. Root172]OBQ72563.1 glycosyl hydrolase family 5 [Mesorhizobium loti]QKC71831.1 DUF2155 domain-containing protein [Mesorhizobium loti]QKC90779.1 DUF2155 domain-containing protein [Mesorhizobium sp. NZP2234]